MSNETPRRLAPTAETVRRLYLLSGNQCAFPQCTDPIIDRDGTYVAELCHICAAEPGGERFDRAQSNEERRHFDNLLLMCHPHHKTTDDVDQYSVERMRVIKGEHEARFERGLASMEASAAVVIVASDIALGGQGGQAAGAGGGGGGAIGPGARAGSGGGGGHVLDEEAIMKIFGQYLVPEGQGDEFAPAHALPKRSNVLSREAWLQNIDLGDGSDGHAVFDGSKEPAGSRRLSVISYALTRDVQYSTALIVNGVVLHVAGCDVRVNVSMIVDGTIDAAYADDPLESHGRMRGVRIRARRLVVEGSINADGKLPGEGGGIAIVEALVCSGSGLVSSNGANGTNG